MIALWLIYSDLLISPRNQDHAKQKQKPGEYKPAIIQMLFSAPRTENMLNTVHAYIWMCNVSNIFRLSKSLPSLFFDEHICWKKKYKNLFTSNEGILITCYQITNRAEQVLSALSGSGPSVIKSPHHTHKHARRRTQKDTHLRAKGDSLPSANPGLWQGKSNPIHVHSYLKCVRVKTK